jgi:GxxExxY protein
MMHHEGTKGTKDTKKRGLVVSQAVVGAAIEVHRELESQIRLDLLVESVVVVEVKAAEKLTPIHGAQLLTYLKITGHPVGLLRNFNVQLLKHGMRRLLNG